MTFRHRARLLVIFDLNGTLVDSTHHRHLKDRDADAMARRKYVYWRPGLFEFMAFLFSHPDLYEIGVWTSNIAANAEAIVSTFLSDTQRAQLAFVWGREHCRQGPGFTTFKDVDTVSRAGYDLRRTIIVDDSEDKIYPPDSPCWYHIDSFEGGMTSEEDEPDYELERLRIALETKISLLQYTRLDE